MEQAKKRNVEELITPPGSPKRSKIERNISDLSPSIERENKNESKFRVFLDCFLTSINHSGYCSENEHFVWHKGIDPEYPKGYYCCQNVCHSSEQTLHIKCIGVVCVVYGKLGPLGILDQKNSNDIRNRISQLGGDSSVNMEVTGFSCFREDVKLKRISTHSYPSKYQPNSAAWK